MRLYLNITSHDKDVFWYMQLGYIKLGLIFGLSLRFNPYVLCAINTGSVESMLFSCYGLVTNFCQIEFLGVGNCLLF